MFQERKIEFKVKKDVEIVVISDPDKHKNKIRRILKDLEKKPIFKKYIEEMIKNAEEELKNTISDTYLKPYIPGSSIKGFFRTVLMTYIISKSNRFRINRHNLEYLDNKSNKYKTSKEFNQLMHLIGFRDIVENDLDNFDGNNFTIQLKDDRSRGKFIKSLKIMAKAGLRGKMTMLLDEEIYERKFELFEKSLEISEDSLEKLIINSLKRYYDIIKNRYHLDFRNYGYNLENTFPIFIGKKSGAIFKVVPNKAKIKGGKSWKKGEIQIQF